MKGTRPLDNTKPIDNRKQPNPSRFSISKSRQLAIKGWVIGFCAVAHPQDRITT